MCRAITRQCFWTGNPSLLNTPALSSSALLIFSYCSPASIRLPLAQASTLLLSCRLMIRALVCSSLSLSPPRSLIIPSFLLLSLTYPNSFPSIFVPKPFNRHGTSTDANNKRPNGRQNDSFDDVKVKKVLTEGSNFDDYGTQVRWYHLSEQRLLVSAPKVGEGLQAKPWASEDEQKVANVKIILSFFWKIKHEPQKICHVFSSGTYIQSRRVQWWTEKMYNLYESRGFTALSEHEWWHGSWRRTELLWGSEAWMFKMRTKKEEGRKEQTKTCYWCSSNQNAWQLSSSW